MKRFLISTILMTVFFLALPISPRAEEGPVTFYGSIGTTAQIDQEATLSSAQASIRFGIKTYLNKEGTWRLITEYNSIDLLVKKNAAGGKNVKSIDVGAERLYWLGVKNGFFANFAFVARGALDMEVNLTDNDVNVALGFGVLKKLSVDKDGNSLLAVQLSFDNRIRNDEKDDIALFATLNLTPPGL